MPRPVWMPGHLGSMSPVPPFPDASTFDSSKDAPVGDPTREAVSSLRGYAYQVAASAIAWLGLDNESRLYLEVAEDYAVIAAEALKAIQVKDTAASASVTLNTEGVRDAIASFVNLVGLNSKRTVYLHYLTTSSIGLERDTKDRPSSEAGLVYWRKAAAGADVRPLRLILEGMRFPEEVKEFVRVRNDDQLRNDLLRKIFWDCGAPDLSEVQRELEDRLIVLARDWGGVPSTDARRLANTVMHYTLKKAVLDKASNRFLTRSELYEVIDGATRVSLSRTGFEALMADRATVTWVIVGLLVDRIHRRLGESFAIPTASLPSDAISEAELDQDLIQTVKLRFLNLSKRLQDSRRLGQGWRATVLESPEAKELFELLSAVRGRTNVIRLLFELSDFIHVVSDKMISAVTAHPESPNAEGFLEGMKKAVSAIKNSQRQFQEMHSKWVASLNDKLDTRSVHEILRIASALELELRLTRLFGDRRTLCIDTDVMMHFASIGTTSESSGPNGAFAFYLLKEQSPIPLRMTYPHSIEVRALLLAMMRGLDSKSSIVDMRTQIQRLTFLLQERGMKPLLDTALMMTGFQEIGACTEQIMHLFMKGISRHPYHSLRPLEMDASALAQLLWMNKERQKTEGISTLVTTTKRVLSLPGMIRQSEETLLGSFSDYELAVQDVYGPAFGSFAYATGMSRDSAHLELVASATAELKSSILQIVRRTERQGGAIDRAHLQHLHEVIRNFGTFVEPFHAQVAKTLETELESRLKELQRWMMDIPVGQNIIDDVILEVITWLDSAASDFSRSGD
jgi:hypothetical protein